MRVSSNHSHHNWKVGKLLYISVFLAVFLSTCGPPKNATLLNGADPLPADNLVWSPSGNELAIATIRGNPPVSGIYILDVKTRKMRPVINQDPGNVWAYSWTPDRKQLVLFVSSKKGFEQGTWLADPNGIQPPKFFLSDPVFAWFPNGEIVIFRKDPSTQMVSLYLHNTKTNDETNIFSSTGIGIGALSSSSDGSKLVFLFQRDFAGNNGIYVFDANTKKTIQVIPDGDVWEPSLSPDGNMIAYLKADYLHIMKSDGSCDVEVPGHLDVGSPVWSPDGKQIAYIGNDEGIYLLDLVGAFGEDILEKGLPCL